MFKLLRYPLITSLTVFILITIVLALFYNQAVKNDLTKLEENKNIALTKSFANSLWPQFASFANSDITEMTASELMVHPEVQSFHQAVLAQMKGLSVLKMKIYNLDGLTVYSSEFEQIGENKYDNLGFQAGLAGQTASELTYRDNFNAFEGMITDRDIVESYVPIRQGNDLGNPVEAVTELYSDVTPFLKTITSTQNRLVQGIALLLLLLFITLFFIIWRADKILLQQYRSLEHVNTELAKRSKKLEQLNTKLKNSNTELEQFSYTASHDLQEPLRKIQAFGEHLIETRSDSLGDDRLYLERMQNAAGRMRNLIQDLLAYSRVGTQGRTFVPVDLTKVAQEIISDLEVSIKEAKARVDLSPLPVIVADSLQMHQLLQNLISNALKFHRNDVSPVVKVYSEVDEQNLKIIVKDNGIGFDQKYTDRIFTMFQRLHGRDTYEGTGVGLAIVRKIVERHEGKIVAESEVGAGASFSIIFPHPNIGQTELREAA